MGCQDRRLNLLILEIMKDTNTGMLQQKHGESSEKTKES